MPILKRLGLRTAQDAFKAALVAAMVIVMGVFIVFPLYEMFRQAFLSKDGQFVGFGNFAAYFRTPSLARSVLHSLNVSLWSTFVAVSLAFGFAYALVRTNMRGKRIYQYIVLLPLFAPTMMHGIGLVYLFGNQGLITTGFFGSVPVHWKAELYGPFGIILSEIVYTFPHAFLILTVALSSADGRLYEAAESMGAGIVRRFVRLTLPNAKYGLISAVFVCFTLSFTDFGAPKVVGGQYNVLATDIYKQVIGQQNFMMGSVVGLLLTLPALAAFVADRLADRKQQAYTNARSTALKVRPNRARNVVAHLYCGIVAGCVLVLIGAVAYASVVKVWPYKLELTWSHYDFSHVAAEGMKPFRNSVWIATYTAIAGTIVTFLFAYVNEKAKIWPFVRRIGQFLSILPLALPGLVIGLGFIFFFNKPHMPLHFLYGTAAILVIVNVVHFYSVPYLTAVTALKKLDPDFERAAESMGAPAYRTFFRVTVPLALPAILEMAVYYFVNAMVTVSAVIFLYSADWKLAAVSIVNMDDAGDVAEAAAMSMLVLGTNVVMRLVYELATHGIRRRAAAWRKPANE